MPTTTTKTSLPPVAVCTKAQALKLVLKDITEMGISTNKVDQTVKDESTGSLTPPSSSATTPKAAASFTPAPCAGGQAALILLDSDDSATSDTTPSRAARLLLKQREKSPSTQVVGAAVVPRNMKRVKKGRVALDKSAKKTHQNYKNPYQACDQILAAFEKQKRASRSNSSATSSRQTTPPPTEPVSAPMDDDESSIEDVEMTDAPALEIDSDSVSSSIIDEFLAGIPTANNITDNLDEDGFTDEDELDHDKEEQNSITNLTPAADDTLVYATTSEQPPVEESLPLSRSEEKVMNAKQVDVAPAAAVNAEEVKDMYVAGLLTMSNGSGHDVAARQQEIDLVALHVAPYVEPSSQTREKKSNKAKKVVEAVPTLDSTEKTHAPIDVLSSIDTPSMDWPVVDEELLIVEQLDASEESINTEDFSPIEPSSASEDIDTEQMPQLIDDNDMPSSSDEDVLPHSSPIESRGRSRPASSKASSSKASSSTSSAAEAADRDLYIARHTFVGITSLEDFISRLPYEESDCTTTMQDICNTFVACAADECEVFLGSPSNVPEVDVDTASTLQQRKIKMGKTTLYGFLRAIAFDDDGVACVGSVVGAFKKAATVDDVPSRKVMMALQAESESEV
jgi:hypothetical protein